MANPKRCSALPNIFSLAQMVGRIRPKTLLQLVGFATPHATERSKLDRLSNIEHM